ncbi:Serine/threonine-protein kinase ppk13 [Madurella mycetomatis]|uniref:non-specific serine/threonine protein kinase n=1 Tax=Madurella mycetomatis TaxID=100816 RepID=A0A175VX02_9PEZI|nr:Serine/threonine-protein kinase ppk13 [Madurella mycetomatis]KXX77475.1 Serine/threonine-protein kinase ppk13 [Madurella mycetomatis]
MAQVFFDLLSSFGSCLNCFPGSPTLKINSRSFKILRLLGEGGFSYVYLVQDTSTSELFALKKIRCPFGAESVAQAMKEVEAYKLFAHSPGVIHSVDYSIASERGGGGGDDGQSKTVYVLLPYYRRGNLQDMINANLVNHTKFPEKRLMLLFLGVCRALKDMHQYRGPGAASGGERMEMRPDGVDENVRAARGARRADDEDETEQQRPLMTEDERMPAAVPGAMRSYAHRDIKPANIMISDSGADPILMDLGSIAVSPLPITSRSLAIATQDTAAEHSTMPYRAPELFDVKTGTVIDTKVDIWSLGCTLYACLVGKSPFEMRSDETGGSLSICVLSGDWRFPDEGPGAKQKAKATAGADDVAAISEPIREVVRACLKVEPSERPDIDELIGMVERVVEELPEDDSA